MTATDIEVPCHFHEYLTPSIPCLFCGAIP